MRNARDILAMIRSKSSYSSMGASLGDRLEKISNYRRGVNLHTEPKRPEKAMPAISREVEKLAQALGMDPYQLDDMMNHRVDPEDQLSVEALRRYLVTLKLADRVDFSVSRSKLDRAEQEHRKRLDSWEKECQMVRERNQTLMAEQEAATNLFREQWGHRVDDILRQAGQPSGGLMIRDLPNQIHWLMAVMSEKWPEAVWEDQQGVGWDREKIVEIASNPDDVRTLFRYAQMDERDEKISNHKKWVVGATAGQINEALISTRDEEEIKLYQRILLVRQGMVPMVGDYGDVNWEVMVMRLNDQNTFYEAVRGWDVEYEEELAIREQFRALNDTHEDVLIAMLIAEYYGERYQPPQHVNID